MLIYYYFKSYGAMKAEMAETEFIDEDTDEDESLAKSKKKVIEGLVTVDFFVSKNAMERLI